MNIADLRKSYDRAELNESDSHAEPLKQFDQWLQEAITANVPEPNAMTLATVGSDLRPSTRVVLIKGYDPQRSGLVHQLRQPQRPAAGRQSVCGAAVSLGRARTRGAYRRHRRSAWKPSLSDDYFDSRPLGSRIGAWASPQSQPIASRAVLEANAERYAAAFGEDVPRPPHWGGYGSCPTGGSSGRDARAACTTGCGTARPMQRLRPAGASTWRRDRFAP